MRGTNRDFSQESGDTVDILSQEVVQWKHIWLLRTEKNVVGKVLNHLCNE